MGPAAHRFYVSPSQKPSSGPPKYKYYHYGYDRDVVQVVMGHIATIILNVIELYIKKRICQEFFVCCFFIINSSVC